MRRQTIRFTHDRLVFRYRARFRPETLLEYIRAKLGVLHLLPLRLVR